jgi:glycosyltransferase involved in cell wall biosynthesis
VKDATSTLDPSPRHHLFVLTGATASADERGAFLTPDQLRRVEKLAQRFDTSLGLKGDPRRGSISDGMVRLPSEITPAWYELYASKWRLLNPLYYRGLLAHVRQADSLLVVMPVLEGVPTLFLGRLLAKPSYLLLVARSFGFRIQGGDKNAFRRAQGRVLVNLAGLLATRILAHGPYLVREFVRPLRRKVLVTLQTTLSDADFLPITPQRTESVELLIVSRLVATKRVDVAIRAMPLLAAKGIQAHLSVVGDGPERALLEELVERSAMDDIISFHGYLDAATVRARYESAFAFVLPSETEGVSLAIMEAMAAGTPVVATRAGGLSGFLKDGFNSVVITPDPANLAAGIERLVREPGLYAAIAKRAQEEMRSVRLDEWVEQLGDLVDDALAKRRAR